MYIVGNPICSENNKEGYGISTVATFKLKYSEAK